MAAGIQRLLDAQMNFVRNAGFVYYRLRNFTDIQSQTFAQLGFQVTSANGGTTDILVAPLKCGRAVPCAGATVQFSIHARRGAWRGVRRRRVVFTTSGGR